MKPLVGCWYVVKGALGGGASGLSLEWVLYTFA